jgi:hypothetical protein
MAKPRLSNVLVVGVEWGRQTGAIAKGVTDRLADGLLQRFQRGGFRATWALSEFHVPAAERLRDAAVGQEIALDATIQTPRDAQHSAAFGAWLRDRLQRAEQCGITIRSLVLDSQGCPPYQTIAQLGFRTLRSSQSPASRLARPVQPQSLRFGLCYLPVSLRWPQASRRWSSFWRHPMAYHVPAAMMRDAVVHLVFDLSAMAARPDRALRQVDRLLDLAASLREREHLTSASLADIEQLIQAATVARPARSILRNAA